MNAKAIQMSFVRENGWMKNEYMHGGGWAVRWDGRVAWKRYDKKRLVYLCNGDFIKLLRIFSVKVALSLPVHRFQMAKYKADDICTLRLEWQRQAEYGNNSNNDDDDDDKKCKRIRKFEALGNWALILSPTVGYTPRVPFLFVTNDNLCFCKLFSPSGWARGSFYLNHFWLEGAELCMQTHWTAASGIYRNGRVWIATRKMNAWQWTMMWTNERTSKQASKRASKETQMKTNNIKKKSDIN